MDSHAVSLLVLSATFAVVVAFLLAKLFRRKRLRLPPGPSGLPFFGNFFTLAFSKVEPQELIKQWAKKYGDMHSFSLFGTHFVVLNEISLAQEIYLGEDVNSRAPMMPCNKALHRPNTSEKRDYILHFFLHHFFMLKPNMFAIIK